MKTSQELNLPCGLCALRFDQNRECHGQTVRLGKSPLKHVNTQGMGMMFEIWK